MNTHTRTFVLLRGSLLFALLVFSACASTPKQVPYPAFIQTDELVDIFMVGLPGIRAKQLSGNPKTRRSSNRLLLPPDWSFSTGASPDKSVELYVLSGDVKLGEFDLGPGGYAYIPPGSTGLGMATTGGASLLYFLDDANPDSVIQTPMILSRDILSWQPVSESPNDLGVSIKELRFDPGSGVRTVLLRMNAGATRPWLTSSMAEEGYLLQGTDHHSECVAGKVLTDSYTPGGYYHRPPASGNARLADEKSADAVWLVRTQGRAEIMQLAGCAAAQE
jgi:hypothetical protein